jgi:signal transduction histidine kinase
MILLINSIHLYFFLYFNIIIKDSWIWIYKRYIKKIFDKFYRVKKHRDRDWIGLWLSIVNKIVKINSWKINVKSIEWEWTEVILKI